MRDGRRARRRSAEERRVNTPLPLPPQQFAGQHEKDLGAMTRGTTRPIILHGNVGPGINTRAKRRKE